MNRKTNKYNTTSGDIPTIDHVALGEIVQNAADGIWYQRVGDGSPTDTIEKLGSERGGILWDDKTEYLVGDIVSDNLDHKQYVATVQSQGVQPSGGGAVWKLFTIDNVVTSKKAGKEIRIPEIVEMTQANYNALGNGRPQKLYIIVG